MIRMTRIDGREVALRCSEIEYLYQQGCSCTVVTNTHGFIRVKESPEAVIRLFTEEKARLFSLAG
ncbi:MAG: hypothetical protein PHQ23_12320 [Candidatus Wallbacteria bacterium]|nr:hypothetical protein [Candidatus Wallbacteria bacterium]